MYQHVIFDLDGTLLNTIEDLADASNWVCRNHGWPTHSVEEYKYFVGNGMTQLVLRFSPPEWNSPEGLAIILREFMTYYDTHKADKTAAYAGMPEAVARMKEAGVSLAVLSNKPHGQAVDVVRQIFGDGVFDFVQGQSEELPRKPDPAGVLYLLDKMGIKKEECVYVGDSEVDVATAKAAGVTGLAATWGFRSRQVLEEAGAGVLIDYPGELVDFLRGRG